MNKKILIPVFLLIALAFILPPVYAISWRHDLESALKAAKSQQKPVLIDFYTEWCGWCKKLDSDTYSDSRVNSASEKFVCVKIDAEKEPEIANKYGVTGFPTIIFLDSNASVISTIPGYLPPDEFLANMNKILSSLPKPSPEKKAEPKKEGGSLVVIDNPAGGKYKKGAPVKTVGQEFVYNGYIQTPEEELLAQINYKGNTYFVKKDENFAEFTVVSLDREKVVLISDKKEITLEYKKPYGKENLLDELSRTITLPSAQKILTVPSAVTESFPALAAGKIRGMILAISSLILLILYVYLSLCLKLIANKTGTPNAWIAWMPLLNIILMLDIGRIKYRTILIPLFMFFLLIFVSISFFDSAYRPIVSLVFAGIIFLNSVYFVFLMAYIWYKIAVARGKSTWLAILLMVMMFISPLNLLALGYLAFSR